MGRAAAHLAELVAAMSVGGQKRHFDRAPATSGLPLMNRHRQHRSACLKGARNGPGDPKAPRLFTRPEADIGNALRKSFRWCRHGTVSFVLR
jgi:hypothetical protein